MNDVTNAEALDMMRRCRDEIMSLRREVERLAPKAEAYDRIGAILNLLPRPSTGHGEDLAWRLEKRIKELSEPRPADG